MAPLARAAAAAALAAGGLLSLQGCGDRGGDGTTPAPTPTEPKPTYPPTPAPTALPPAGSPMVDAVRLAEGMITLEALNSIARRYITPWAPNGSRDRFVGHVDSKDYILERLAGFAPELDPVVLPYEDPMWKKTGIEKFEITKPTPKVFPVEGDDATALMADWSAKGVVTGQLAFPSDAKGEGCSENDYTDENMKGKIAFINRGECTFCNKAKFAAQHGATGVIIALREGESHHDPPFRVSLAPRSCGENFPHLPTFSVEHAVGQELKKAEEITMTSDTEIDDTTGSSNICLNLPGGDPNKVMMIGAHLDSVAAGPGMNDNGSGSANVLEIVRAFGVRYGFKGDSPLQKNSFRVCWWGSEEHGLIGSRKYVTSLSQAERDKILGYLNFDMTASPNGYNGINEGSAEEWNPTASGYIEEEFRKAFTANGNAPSKKAGLARSDFAPFMDNSIPMGGILTGAEDGFASQEEADTYGGDFSMPHDPCYHKVCDTPDNIDQDRMFLFTKVTATVVQNFLEDEQLSVKLTRQNLKEPINPPPPVLLSSMSDGPSDAMPKAAATPEFVAADAFNAPLFL